MRPRIRPCRLHRPLSAVALAAAALCGRPDAAGAAEGRPVVVADVMPIPTSPSFRMGMRRGDSGAPTVSHPGELPRHGEGSEGDAILVNPAKDAGAKPPAHAASAAGTAASAASAPKARAANAVEEKPAAARANAAAPERPAPTRAKAAVTRDPDPAEVLDHLRERLAEKLGATPAGGGSRFVMRVSNRGESGENLVSTARAPASTHLPAASAAARGAHADGLGPDEELLHPQSWAYAGPAGPEAWGHLPGYEKCADGTRQSPIDIRDGIAVDLEPIAFDYRPGGFSVTDTGHTVQVDVAPGNAITIMGRRYELVQFHFHRPAEERIDGRGFDMVAHLVHQDPAGHVAVVAVLLERGTAQPVVQSVWNNLPLEKGEPLKADVPLDPANLLPADRRYYTYMGSLTTPPCTEGVLWMVMKQPVQISPEQDAIFAHLYPMNARPLQQAQGRLIKASN